MYRTLFSKPVMISVGIIGEPIHLMSAGQAVDLLSKRWRINGSPKQKAAIRACRQATSGAIGADIARYEVVLAAREANVLIE
jgi:hypothetical protein